MITITPEEKNKLCERCMYKLYGLSQHCPECPLTRTGRRDRKAYMQKYYQEVVKPNRRRKSDEKKKDCNN